MPDVISPARAVRGAPRDGGPGSGAARSAADGVPRARRRARPRGLGAHLIGLAALVLVPAFAAGGLAAWWAVDAYRAGFEQRLEDTTRAVSIALDGEIERLRPLAGLLAASPLVGPGTTDADLSELYVWAKRLAEAFDTWVWMTGPGPGHARLFHTTRPLDTSVAFGPLPPESDEARARAGEAGAPVVSDLTSSPLLSRFVAGVVAPIRRGGRDVGALGVTLDPVRLSRVLSAQGLTDGEFATLIDGRGRVVAHSHDADRLVGSRVPAWYAQETAGRERGIVVGRALEGREMVFGFARLPNTPAWSVVVAEPLDVYRASWMRPLLMLAAGGVLAGGLAAVAASRVAERLLRPLDRLAHRAAAIARGQPPPRTEGNGGGAQVAEFEALRASVDAADAALRREAEAARRERELLVSVVEGTADAVFVKDLDGRYVLANAATAAILGQPAARVVGRTDADLLPLAAAVLAKTDRQVLIEDRAITVEEAVPDPAGGPPRVFLSTKAPWRDAATGAAIGVIGVSHDVSERVHAELKLRDAERALHHLARRATVGAMASGIAHELNQPLAAATNFLEGAARLLEPDAVAPGGHAGPASPTPQRLAAATRGLERAAGQVVRAGEILRRLRDFIGRGETDRREEPVAEVVEEAMALALAGSPDAGLDAARFEADPGAGAVWMDRVQMQQVMVNLVRNAIEAMRDLPPGRPRELSVRVRRLDTPDDSGRVEVSVADTGPGIAPEAARRLFEPFHSTKPGGMGVGLSICRTIVEAHGGRLTAGAASKAGGGAEFRFVLVQGRGTSSAEADEDHRCELAGATGSDAR